MIKDKKFDKILDAIKSKRKEKGMSQNEISRQLGISQVSYNNLENGRTSITIERLFLVCKVLDMNPYYLLRKILPDPELEIQNELEDSLKGYMAPLKKFHSLLLGHLNSLVESVESIEKEVTEKNKQWFDQEVKSIRDLIFLIENQMEVLERPFSEKKEERVTVEWSRGPKGETTHKVRDLRYHWPADEE